MMLVKEMCVGKSDNLTRMYVIYICLVTCYNTCMFAYICFFPLQNIITIDHYY